MAVTSVCRISDVTVRSYSRYVTRHSGELSILPSVSSGQRQWQCCLYWEGNRRSGVALAIHHILCGKSTYGLNGL